jgi:anti-sigma factor RsiW
VRLSAGRRRRQPRPPPVAHSSETSFRFGEDQGARVYHWIDGPFGHSLAGGIDRDELQMIARGVYRQLNP